MWELGERGGFSFCVCRRRKTGTLPAAARALKRVFPPLFPLPRAGAIKYLAQRFDMSKVRMVGASGGAIASVLAACGVSPDRAVEHAYAMSLEHNIWERPLALLGTWGRLIEQVRYTFFGLGTPRLGAGCVLSSLWGGLVWAGCTPSCLGTPHLGKLAGARGCILSSTAPAAAVAAVAGRPAAGQRARDLPRARDGGGDDAARLRADGRQRLHLQARPHPRRHGLLAHPLRAGPQAHQDLQVRASCFLWGQASGAGAGRREQRAGRGRA